MYVTGFHFSTRVVWISIEFARAVILLKSRKNKDFVYLQNIIIEFFYLQKTFDCSALFKFNLRNEDLCKNINF